MEGRREPERNWSKTGKTVGIREHASCPFFFVNIYSSESSGNAKI